MMLWVNCAWRDHAVAPGVFVAWAWSLFFVTPNTVTAQTTTTKAESLNWTKPESDNTAYYVFAAMGGVVLLLGGYCLYVKRFARSSKLSLSRQAGNTYHADRQQSSDKNELDAEFQQHVKGTLVDKRFPMAFLMRPPKTISDEQASEVRSAATELLERFPEQKATPRVALCFDDGTRSEDALSCGPGTFFAASITKFLWENDIPCVSKLMVPLDEDGETPWFCCGSGTSSDTYTTWCKTRNVLIIIETVSLYISIECLTDIFNAIESKSTIVRVRFEDPLPAVDCQWPTALASSSEQDMKEVVQTYMSNIRAFPEAPSTIPKQTYHLYNMRRAVESRVPRTPLDWAKPQTVASQNSSKRVTLVDLRDDLSEDSTVSENSEREETAYYFDASRASSDQSLAVSLCDSAGSSGSKPVAESSNPSIASSKQVAKGPRSKTSVTVSKRVGGQDVKAKQPRKSKSEESVAVSKGSSDRSVNDIMNSKSASEIVQLLDASGPSSADRSESSFDKGDSTGAESQFLAVPSLTATAATRQKWVKKGQASQSGRPSHLRKKVTSSEKSNNPPDADAAQTASVSKLGKKGRKSQKSTSGKSNNPPDADAAQTASLSKIGKPGYKSQKSFKPPDADVIGMSQSVD